MFRWIGTHRDRISRPGPAWPIRYVQKLDFRINYTYDGKLFRAREEWKHARNYSFGRRARAAEDERSGIRHLAVSVDQFSTPRSGNCTTAVSNSSSEPYNNQRQRLVFFSDIDGNILHLIQRERPLP